MKTDINRLHQVALGRNKGRRCGKTTLKCHEIAGVIETGDKETVVAMVEYQKDISHILPILIDVLKEHNLDILKIQKTSNRLYVQDKNVLFVTQKRPEMLEGIDANIVFMCDNDKCL